MDSVNLNLLQTVIDSQKEFIIIFHDDKVTLTNKNFNKFFGISSVDEFNSNYLPFVDNFISHPYYFHKEKMAKTESWFDSIVKLPEKDRIVSMLTQNFEPHAFSIEIDTNVEEHKIVTFTDITQDLIKRIMIENNANIDKKTGAYSKQYFQQIAKSYEYAANFNEKSIATILITLPNENNNELTTFVNCFKNIIRQDDMLINWGKNKFLLVYLIDADSNAHKMLSKLNNMLSIEPLKEFNLELELKIQEKDENIKSLINRI